VVIDEFVEKKGCVWFQNGGVGVDGDNLIKDAWHSSRLRDLIALRCDML
jgi:hypothetical protein